jgi:phthiocerol/phenolphthiocerol synthesis type-I polyketide synthase B
MREPVELGGNSDAQSGGVIPPEWYCELTWPVRPLSVGPTTASNSWLVVAEAGAGAEIGRVLGDDSRVTILAPSALAQHADQAALCDALAGVSHVLYAPEGSSSGLDADSGIVCSIRPGG